MATIPKQTLSQNRPGRPSSDGARDVRATLLKAARELFTRHGFKSVTTKRIAEHAGVNPAMIHYYFGDKAGLHGAMLQEAMEPLLGRLTQWADAPDESEFTIDDFVTAYMRILAANPWLPQLVVREVLTEGGRLREMFITEIGGRAGRVVPELIKRGVAEGELRPDLDPTLATLSLASLVIFPFVAAPVIGRVLNFKIDDEFVSRLISHTVAVFHHGTAKGTMP